MKHYKYGGSTAARTMGCPAWHKLSEDMPKQKVSKYADIGTMLHDCMEDLIIKDNLTPQDCLGRRHKGESGVYTVSQDMIDEKLTPALEAFEQLMDDYDVEMYEAERTMEYNEDTGGTADFIARGGDTVIIGDWKFGDGIQVMPAFNKQGIFYAWLAKQTKELKDFFDGAKRLVIVIVQPNNRGLDTCRVWDATKHQSIGFVINTFDDEHYASVSMSKREDPVPCVGEWCNFCPAMPTCPAKTGLILAQKRLNDVDKIKQIGEALDQAKQMEDWIKAVRAFAHDQAELGIKFDGWKLVNKRPVTRWVDEDKVLNDIRLSRKLKLEDGTITKVLSPAQLKKVCKQKGVDFKKFEVQTHSTSSGTTLALDTDKREEVLAADAFKALKDMI